MGEVLPIEGYKRRLRPKGAPFLGSQHTKELGKLFLYMKEKKSATEWKSQVNERVPNLAEMTMQNT